MEQFLPEGISGEDVITLLAATSAFLVMMAIWSTGIMSKTQWIVALKLSKKEAPRFKKRLCSPCENVVKPYQKQKIMSVSCMAL